MRYGCQSMVGKIERIIIKRPVDAFISKEYLEAHWKAFNYSGCPDYEKVVREYEAFEKIIKTHVPEVHYLSRRDEVGLDSIYTHDAMKITQKGAILMNMGKEQRKNEPVVMKDFLTGLGIPILGAICGNGRMEGGDVVWLDEKTLVAARGYRTNDEGIQQLGELTKDIVNEFIVVPLPHAGGPFECLHLMSIISMIDKDLAVVYSRYMPVFFRELLIDRGIQLIEVDDEEYNSLGSNVLALAPRKCLVLAGNPGTKQKMEAAGVEVFEYEGSELSLKGTGGPTCLTCPVLRL
ncbi:MAG: amidinotransferase [Candidatus Aminicenantes bacterium]|nr:MAG: amidinotransferase [Candidatus Aminicenantes bacterium]